MVAQDKHLAAIEATNHAARTHADQRPDPANPGLMPTSVVAADNSDAQTTAKSASSALEVSPISKTLS